MPVELFIEYLVRGILSGAVYGLLALPMSLMFATVRSIDFAVGAYALVAAAVGASVVGAFGILAGLTVAVGASAVMGVIFILMKRAGCDDQVVHALASFGLSVALASIVLWQSGPEALVRESFNQYWSLLGVRVSPQGVVNLATCVLIVAVLYGALYGTELGRMMRAAAANPRGSELAGIPVEQVQFATYLVGGLLAGIAGILILFSSGLDFSAPLSLTLAGFGAAIIFGVHSPLRCLFGGLAMGVAEALAAGYTSGMITTMVPFVFVLIVLGTRRFSEAALAGDRP